MRCKEQFDSWFGKIRPQEKSECVSVCVCVFSGSLERDLGNTANSLSAKLMACVPLKTSSEEFDLVVNILMWVNLSIHILEHCAFFPLL